ncbi:MAG: GDSL-type esterase/lipase family protein [Polyangiaceae bacterium]
MSTFIVRICFFGDSFVNGTGDDDGLGWVGRVVARARQGGRDVTAYNLGIRRDTSADVAARWMREARPRLPHEHDGRLVFSFGANDCTANREDGSPRAELAASMNGRDQDSRRHVRPHRGPPHPGPAPSTASPPIT